MPELPEVEVSRLGISPHLLNQTIQRIDVHQPSLRWPVPDEVHQAEGQVIRNIRRRAKYLLIDTDSGSILLHLGMSGKLRVLPSESTLKKHDHLEVHLHNGQCLRLNDPRRFGACLWQGAEEPESELLTSLGPEPLTDDFDGDRLFSLSRNKSAPVKTFIMDNKVVVGVGNIYANEALFMAGIDPRRSAGRISRKRYLSLAEKIKLVLAKAIAQGGTTLRDFTQADGNPGYFAQQLMVYGRANEPCEQCNQPITSLVIGQRNTFYCRQCQR